MRHAVNNPALLITLLPLLFAGGCKACYPSLPGPPVITQDDSSAEDDSADDSAPDSVDSVDSVDTAPEPPCDVPEVESNNNPNSPQALPLDEWACGTFTSSLDPESFGFSIDQADWVRVEVRAASINTSADVSLNLVEVDGDYSAAAPGSYFSTDPFLVFPTDQARDFVAVLSEAYYGYGEDYGWEMMASVTKAPVTWEVEEIESNNDTTLATPLAVGDTLMGTIADSSDLDWLSISVPDDEKHTMSVRVYAARLGSPADLRAVVYDPTGAWRKTAITGENSYDRDPWADVTTDMAGEWKILLREDYSKGSPVYWYTVVVTLDTAAEE